MPAIEKRIATFSYLVATIGLSALVVTFASYESYNPDFFGRWSAMWVVILLATVGLAIVAAWHVRLQMRSPFGFGARAVGSLTVGVWALVYSYECWLRTVSADTGPPGRERLPAEWTEGQFFIAVTVPGVLGEWVVLVLIGGALLAGLGVAARRYAPAHTRSLATKGILLIGSVVLALVAAEGGLRGRNLLFPEPQGMPTAAAKIFRWRYYNYNDDGYRERQVERQKPDHLTRVVAIGDSFTEGVGIRQPENRLTGVMERELNRGANPARFEVINVGRGDTHTLDHLEALERYFPYEPDLVVLVYVFNDIEHVASTRGSRLPFRPWGKLDPRGLPLVNTHLGMEFLARLNHFPSLPRDRSAADVVSPYDDPEALAAHLDAVNRFFDLCRENDIPAVLVPFDIRFTALPEEAAINRRFVEAVAERGVAVWTTEALFAGKEFSDLRVAPLDGHPNGDAHQAVGLEMARRARELLRVDERVSRSAP